MQLGIKQKKRQTYIMDRSAKTIVFICAITSFLILLGIAFFTLINSLPAFKLGIFSFLFGTEWSPGTGKFGILPMVVGSVMVTIGAMIIAIPLGLACSILLAEIAPYRVRQVPAIELLVGIPSVVYGLVGMITIVPLVRQIGGTGYSLLAASLVLAAMVLPTVISISEDSIRSVPKSFKEGSLALGATQWQTIWHVIIPAARSGIVASIILGIGRAIGETMAMIMVIGNAVQIPASPLDPARTLTGNIAVEISYASGTHRSALFATGVILFLMILIINSMALLILKRSASNAKS
ncbi:MAG: phosphate ABC transporter permease subunit PstC [Chloroflexi bacterium]|nr:phosphate ABC transporter permease subunit PstC [Chloroflexota bacterium]